MTRTRPLVAAGLAVLFVAVAVLLIDVLHGPGVGPRGSQSPGPVYADGPDSPMLVVGPPGQTGHMYAQMQGSLTVNEQGCVVLGDDVVIADAGTRLTDDGGAVVFPGNLVLPLHTGFVGGGGYYGGRKWLEHGARDSWGDERVDAVEQCLGDDGGSVVQVWMSPDDFAPAG